MEVFVLTRFFEPDMVGVYSSLDKAIAAAPSDVRWEVDALTDDPSWSWLDGEDSEGMDWSVYRFVLDAPMR